MTGHTPGPWKVKPIGKEIYVEADHLPGWSSACNPFICDMQASECIDPAQVKEERPRILANAQLIAAAPDLLQALEKLLEEYKACERFIDHGYGKVHPQTLAVAEEAIEKAKGTTVGP